LLAGESSSIHADHSAEVAILARSAGAAGDHHDGPSAAVSEIMLVISKAESPFEDAGVNRATVGPEGGLVGP
jgi:hypothetical protein